MSNNAVAQKPKFSVAISTAGYQKLINNTLGDAKKAQRFIASITSAVSNNSDLEQCDARSILSAGLLGEALNLSPSPQLGQYYLVPYGNSAQFQLGYKGYIQLALRSGCYKKLNVLDIKQGELVKYDPLTETIEINLIENSLERENTKTMGYYAMFEYQNGFVKAIYWSREKMESHALKYSKGYNSKKDGSFWKKDFDGMAFKTMLRQIISKWGLMSIELETAIVSDMGVINEDKTVDYVDNTDENITLSEPVDKVEVVDTVEVSMDEL